MEKREKKPAGSKTMTCLRQKEIKETMTDLYSRETRYPKGNWCHKRKGWERETWRESYPVKYSVVALLSPYPRFL